MLQLANTCSTTSADPDTWTLPSDFHRANQDFRSAPRLPAGACPSPDRHGLTAVFQPDGWVLDAVRDHRSGRSNHPDTVRELRGCLRRRHRVVERSPGKHVACLCRAIRTGEIASGRIPHALAALAPESLLERSAVWPAYAFDSNNHTLGSLPMGSLLAIPPAIDLDSLWLVPTRPCSGSSRPRLWSLPGRPWRLRTDVPGGARRFRHQVGLYSVGATVVADVDLIKYALTLSNEQHLFHAWRRGLPARSASAAP